MTYKAFTTETQRTQKEKEDFGGRTNEDEKPLISLIPLPAVKSVKSVACLFRRFFILFSAAPAISAVKS